MLLCLNEPKLKSCERSKTPQVGEKKKTAAPVKIQWQFRGVVVKHGSSVFFGLSMSPKAEHAQQPKLHGAQFSVFPQTDEPEDD